MIKIQTKQVINVTDWDRWVQKTYGKPYKFQQQDGCRRNDSVVEISVPCRECYDFENDTVFEKINGEERGVSFKAWLARDPKQPVAGEGEDWQLKLWWARNFYPSLDMVVNDLYKRGQLPKGKYLIHINY